MLRGEGLVGRARWPDTQEDDGGGREGGEGEPERATAYWVAHFVWIALTELPHRSAPQRTPLPARARSFSLLTPYLTAPCPMPHSLWQQLSPSCSPGLSRVGCHPVPPGATTTVAVLLALTGGRGRA